MRFLLMPLLLGLYACTSAVPELVRTAPEGDPSLPLVMSVPERYLNATVRWGGTIAGVHNLAGETRVEIVARELSRNGEPKSYDRSEGRFIAIFSHFLDPVIYAPDRNLTVVGRFSETTVKQLGDMDYRYPVVKVTAHYLWPKPVPRYEYYDPFFYDPWYPFRYPHPWYRHPHRF
jgi:outer membrane lipoprotein